VLKLNIDKVTVILRHAQIASTLIAAAYWRAGMPPYIGPALVAADEDASKALKSLSKGDLVAVRCPVDGGETFWLASIVGARKQRTAIRWWERADTRERACADTVYQVGAEAEPQTRDFRKTVLYVVDSSGYKLSAKLSPAGAAAATKGLQLTPRGWEGCDSVAGLATARLSASAGLSNCAAPSQQQQDRCPACGLAAEAHIWRDGWEGSLYEGWCEACYFKAYPDEEKSASEGVAAETLDAEDESEAPSTVAGGRRAGSGPPQEPQPQPAVGKRPRESLGARRGRGPPGQRVRKAPGADGDADARLHQHLLRVKSILGEAHSRQPEEDAAHRPALVDSRISAPPRKRARHARKPGKVAEEAASEEAEEADSDAVEEEEKEEKEEQQEQQQEQQQETSPVKVVGSVSKPRAEPTPRQPREPLPPNHGYDINTAPAGLLESAGASHALARSIVEARPFTSAADARRRVKSFGSAKEKLLEASGMMPGWWAELVPKKLERVQNKADVSVPVLGGAKERTKLPAAEQPPVSTANFQTITDCLQTSLN
jgi:hypothetical protein